MTIKDGLVASRIRAFDSLSSEPAFGDVTTREISTSPNRQSLPFFEVPHQQTKLSKPSTSAVPSESKRQNSAFTRPTPPRRHKLEERSIKLSSRSRSKSREQNDRDRRSHIANGSRRSKTRLAPFITVSSATDDGFASAEERPVLEKLPKKTNHSEPISRRGWKHSDSHWAGEDALASSSRYKQHPMQRSGPPPIPRPTTTTRVPKCSSPLTLADSDIRQLPHGPYIRPITRSRRSTSCADDHGRGFHRLEEYQTVLDTLQNIQRTLSAQSKALETLQTTVHCIADLSQSVIELSATLRQQIKCTASESHHPPATTIGPRVASNLVRPEDSCSQTVTRDTSSSSKPPAETERRIPSIHEVATMIDKAVDEMRLSPPDLRASVPEDVSPTLNRYAFRPWNSATYLLDSPKLRNDFPVLDDDARSLRIPVDASPILPQHPASTSRYLNRSTIRRKPSINTSPIMPGNYPETPETFSPSLHIPFLPSPVGNPMDLDEEDEEQLAFRRSRSLKRRRDPASLAGMLSDPLISVQSPSSPRPIERGRPQLRDMNSLGSSSSRFTSSSRLLASRRPFRS